MMKTIDKKAVAGMLDYLAQHTATSFYQKLYIYGQWTGVEFKEPKCLSIPKTSTKTKLKSA